MDIFEAVDIAIRRQKETDHGLNKKSCLSIFGVSKQGYDAWQKRKANEVHKEYERQQELLQYMEKFRSIVKDLGYVPGKRTFRVLMFRKFDCVISVKKCAKIMKKMNLVANRRKKDAYKGQATHNHRCTAPENLVKQDFYIGPRRVVLTDITYLYYGKYRSTIYLCAFRDPFTREILGAAVGTRMTTELVKKAYNRMMEKHGDELKKSISVYVHSDQGSQYLSTTFKELLSNDKFIQSVSRRGNSQDNAPMESFFGLMKCNILDLVALCPDAKTATRLIEGYIYDYNNKHYQYSIAGLTPSEYYTYLSTGVYPCDSYYGVKATELLSIVDLANARLEAARVKAERARKRNQEKREAAEHLVNEPEAVIAEDQKKLNRLKLKFQKGKEVLDEKIAFIDQIIEKTKNALKFLLSASKDVLDDLRNPHNWKKYKELDYIFDMNEMF